MARRTFDESVKAAHHCAIGKLKLALQLDDDIVTVGRDPLFVLIKLIEEHADGAEIVTVYTGEAGTPEQAETTTKSLEEKFSGFDIEVVHGGQPHYDYLIAVE